MSKAKKKDYTGHPLRTFLGYFGPHKKLFAIDMLCAVAAAGIDLPALCDRLVRGALAC